MDIEEQLQQLEDTISLAENSIHTEQKAQLKSGIETMVGVKGTCIHYTVILGVIAPMIIFAALYYSKLTIITKKGKGRTIDQKRFAGVLAAATLGVWIILYALHYFHIITGCISWGGKMA